MKYLIVLLLMGCVANSNENLGEFEMSCNKVIHSPKVYRCENKEVVCYKAYSYDSGISCNFK